MDFLNDIWDRALDLGTAYGERRLGNVDSAEKVKTNDNTRLIIIVAVVGLVLIVGAWVLTRKS